jgi:hypothetical protein
MPNPTLSGACVLHVLNGHWMGLAVVGKSACQVVARWDSADCILLTGCRLVLDGRAFRPMTAWAYPFHAGLQAALKLGDDGTGIFSAMR